MFCSHESFDFRFVSCKYTRRWKTWTACFYFLIYSRKLFQMEIFHQLVYLINWNSVQTFFVILVITKSARILDNFSKDSLISYFDFLVIFVFFRNLENDKPELQLTCLWDWPLSGKYISELQWFLTHNWESN